MRRVMSMNNSIDRCMKKCNSTAKKQRREISRMEFYEKPVDPEKARRSILMSRFPKRKGKGGDG